jgi:hypothetical protein
MMPIHKLLMTQLYLRHNTSATAVGQMFGFSADSVEKNALPEVLSVLKELFPASRKVKEFRVLKDEYRLAQGIFPTVVSAIVGLLQFSVLMN